MAEQRLRIAIVGCGDVADRHYLPALASMADRIEIAALVDARPQATEALATAVRAAAPAWNDTQPAAFSDLKTMLTSVPLDGAFDLTPAPAHGSVNGEIVAAGVACYSEKPIASTLAEANRLIEASDALKVPLLAATGSAVSARIRWLKAMLDGGRIGRPTLAVAHHADAGPAAWREYTGDPTPFYREGVGPVHDHGVYRLHEMTTVLGPVRRVQAMGSIARPTRPVLGGPLRGTTIDVTTPDHVLIQLEFASGALGQLLASFGTSDTRAPWLEVHGTAGVVSFGGHSWERDAPIYLHLDDESLEGPPPGDEPEEWALVPNVPEDAFGTVGAGAIHFLRVLLGEEEAVLTARHARHVLDVIVKAYASMADGRAYDTETTF
jgi:predicted dehydrogenase